MKKVFRLSKQNIPLAKEEILSVTESKKYNLIDNLLIMETGVSGLYKRLGMTHSIYEFLFKCEKNKLRKTVENYPWVNVYERNFCVRVHSDEQLEKELSIIIYNKLKDPKVNLDNPKTKIEFFIKDKSVFACKHLHDVDKSYLKRKAHLRPELHPTSLHPRLARACVNLTGLKKGIILDPFCGSGGLLIEAGLMGFSVIGYDVDEKQLIRAKKNLKNYNIKDCNLEIKNALNISKKVDAIVTDPPYGKGSKGKNILSIYEKFLKVSHNYTNRLIIMFPDFLDYKSIVKRSPWVYKNEFSIYIHKSLTKIILPLKSD